MKLFNYKSSYKSLLVPVLFVFAMMLPVSCAEYVEEEDSQPEIVTANVTSHSALNVRESPFMTARVVGVAYPHETVEVLMLPTDAPEWAKIRTSQGIEGYSSLKFLELNVTEEQPLEPDMKGEYVPTALQQNQSPYITYINNPTYYVGAIFVAITIILLLMYYYQTPTTRNADFTKRLRQMFGNSWIGNVPDGKNLLWVTVTYLVGWGGVVWLMWLHETDNGFRIELNLSGGFIFLVSQGLVGIYSTFILSQMYHDGYYFDNDIADWVSSGLTYLGSVLSLWFCLVLARAVGTWLAMDIPTVSWIRDAFWAMLLTVAAIGVIDISISMLWAFYIVRYFMRPFHNLGIHVINLGIVIGLGYTSVCFVYEQFTGFDCLIGTFAMVVICLVCFGVMTLVIRHQRCPNCHSYVTSTTGVMDMGLRSESHRESHSIPDYDIKASHSGGVISNAKEHGVRTNVYRDKLTTHRCMMCGNDWEVTESELVSSGYRADSRSYTETYLKR